MSKKATTTRKSSKRSKLVRVSGLGISVKLYRQEGVTKSAAQVATALRAVPYKPKKKNDIAAGFVEVKATGKRINATFVAGFRVRVLTYDADGNLTPVHYVSVDRGHVFIKLDKGTIEVRGSERIARKFCRMYEELTGANVTPLNLNGGTEKLYSHAKSVDAVLLSGIEKGNLSQMEFRGHGIQTEAEIGLYKRKYKGEITRFRGTFSYPSKAFLTTIINAEAGSLMVYKSGDGILEKDLTWIVELMEDAALE
ncbi:MAG: hypothetical protein ACTSYL_04780 [Candidatus Thorarchaeota archaeon]